MSFNKLTMLAVFSIVGNILFSAVAAQAAGPTCTVNGAGGADYMTISAAIADLGCTTINVATGTYNEQVQVTRTLTLRGAQAGVDARTRSGAESIIDHACGPVQIMANNVTLDGFTIQGSTDADPCFLAGIWTNPGFSVTEGGHQILNNIVQNNISGIELDSTCVNPTLVQFNLIQNNNNPGPGSGNGIQTNFGLCNADIDSNKFSGHTNASVLIVAGSDDITVSNNELVGGTLERIVFASVTNTTISGNKSDGSTSSGAIRLFGGNSNIAITSNILRNGVRGIRVDDPFAIGANSGVAADNNCIQGNTVAGLEVGTGGHSGTLNAESNWWGAASGPSGVGPGTGDAIVDPDGVVDFSPFLASPASSCPPPPPPRVIKQNVLASLGALLPTGDKKTDERIEHAIVHLSKSLNPDLWVDDSHLTKKGEKVFNEERDAVHELMEIKHPPAAVMNAISALAAADEALAQTAINDAISGGGKAKDIDKAQDELAKGQMDVA